MFRKPIDVFIFLMLCSTVVSVSCGGGSDNPVDGGDGIGEAIEILTDGQVTILADAEDAFDTLIQTESRESARETLVEQLKATEGVKTAALLEDGSTVWVVFDDGMSGVVSTIDLDAMNAGAADIDYDALKAVTPGNVLKPADSAMLLKTAHEFAPTSKKVLILNISEPSVASTNNVDKLRGLLLDAGWTDDDITIKTRMNKMDNSIMPTDLFKLGDYGIVVIYAHGLYGTPPDSSVTNGHHYLQVCSNIVTGDPMQPQYEQWAKEGKFVFSPKLRGFMRSDLLLQQIEHMSETVVFMCVCWGWEARNAFVSNNCGAYFGWDDMVMAVDAHPWLYQSFKLLTQASPVNTVTDTYEDSRVVKTSLNAFDRTANLHMTPENGDLYFPAWAEVEVKTSLLPAGTTQIGFMAETESGPLFDGALRYLDGDTVEGLKPGPIDITMKALNGAEELAEQNRTVLFHPGKNEVILDLSCQIVSPQLYKYSWESGYHDWGPYSTNFYAYYKWKKNPNGDSYHVTFHMAIR